MLHRAVGYFFILPGEKKWSQISIQGLYIGIKKEAKYLREGNDTLPVAFFRHQDGTAFKLTW